MILSTCECLPRPGERTAASSARFTDQYSSWPVTCVARPGQRTSRPAKTATWVTAGAAVSREKNVGLVKNSLPRGAKSLSTDAWITALTTAYAAKSAAVKSVVLRSSASL